MTKRTRALGLLTCAMLLLTLVAGCSLRIGSAKDESVRAASAFVGVWEDQETLSRAIIALEKGKPVVMKYVDSDGEDFPVLRQSWDGTQLSYTYKVPSTGFEVEIVSQGVAGDVMSTTWSNTDTEGGHSSGTQDFLKVEK
jgi:hypothetical protein